ncbi:cytochrome P450 [Glomus cerebriforme]|uniref:Cytochrome P450 n=1 Tax=Glomus cerebriforme TaxID=658196 RepID=A0A397T9M9_9GLOM|nr:cytochrome P450 [Glomus cerebriforme]
MISLVVIIVCIVLGTINYFLRQRKYSSNPHNQFFISDVRKAKDFLKSSNLGSRVRSNQNLRFIFGISNPFTNSDSSYHSSFRKVITKSINLKNEEWKRIKNIAFESVINYANLEKGGVVEIVPWIQKITLNVVLRGYLEMDVNVDEIINVAPSIINDLWLKSKELDITMSEKNTSILETKHMLKNLFHVAHDDPLADELESPLNILIPAYETMWRVVLYAILEIKVRPSLKNEDPVEGNDFGELDNDVKVFLENPILNKDSTLWCIIHETLRLYPPTRHIHRVDENLNKFTIEVEKIHRDPKNWGEDAALFKPKRFLNLNTNNEAYIPFSGGKLKCIAADKFAPTLAATLISSILDRVDIILTQKSKETLLQKRILPFENSRRAFDKLEITLTKKK